MKQLTEIKARCEAAKNVCMDVENPHVRAIIWDSLKDIPALIITLSIAKKVCPKSGNDGFITPKPCQCELESFVIERDHWKARAEVFRDAIEKRKDCWACKFDDTCNNDFTNECLKNKKHCFQLDEARFMGGESK